MESFESSGSSIEEVACKRARVRAAAAARPFLNNAGGMYTPEYWEAYFAEYRVAIKDIMSELARTGS